MRRVKITDIDTFIKRKNGNLDKTFEIEGDKVMESVHCKVYNPPCLLPNPIIFQCSKSLKKQ